MATDESGLLLCYNKGCGERFDPKENKEDSCCFHPGNPFFHDAYKGWACCEKKTVDFTEFLKIKGCTRSFHSNVKPPEPPKPVVQKPKSNDIYEYTPPTPKVSTLERPPFDTPLTKLHPEVSNTLRTQIESITIQQTKTADSDEIPLSTACKNPGCKALYEGPESLKTDCIHHSGVAVFHEGYKYWSCCNKKTTNFDLFMEQVGCTTGEHVWLKEKNATTQLNCRHDWHQTGSHVFISVYAKKYDPDKSVVEINPIRAKIQLEFPGDNSQFLMDVELCGVVDVAKCEVSMLPTKVEVKLKKAEPGSWPKLEKPVPPAAGAEKKDGEKSKTDAKPAESAQDDIVDLKDIN